MNKFNLNFNNIASLLSLGVGFEGLRRNIKSGYIETETDKLIVDTVRKSGELARTLQEQLEHKKFEDVKLEADLGRVKDQLESINQDVEMLNKFSNNPEGVNPTLIKTSGETLKESAQSASELIDKILNNFNDGNNYNIINHFDNFVNFVKSLTLIQNSILVHVLLLIVILFLLWNILAAYYSNKIITYFNLETRFPRLKRYFELRVKFQDYYIGLNAFIVIVSILYAIYLDYLHFYLTLK